MRGEFLDLADARLYYYAAGTRGAGEPIVFLHGFATSGHLWSDVVSLMPAGHRLVVLDLLGHGRSDPPRARSLTLGAHAERVAQLLDTLGIARACVVGHGLGGGVAQALAVHWPQRVSRLALVSSIGFANWPTRDVRLARFFLPLLRLLPPSWMLSMLRVELERGSGNGDAARASRSIDRYLRPFAGEVGRDTLARHVAALDARETAALAQRLGDVAIPTTVLCGADDPFLPVRLARRLAAAIPGAVLEIVPDVHHFLPEEAPRRVADALAALCAR